LGQVSQLRKIGVKVGIKPKLFKAVDNLIAQHFSPAQRDNQAHGRNDKVLNWHRPFCPASSLLAQEAI
jgi:hypothetical protein